VGARQSIQEKTDKQTATQIIASLAEMVVKILVVVVVLVLMEPGPVAMEALASSSFDTTKML
jgi:type III secretory pathway component EscS